MKFVIIQTKRIIRDETDTVLGTGDVPECDYRNGRGSEVWQRKDAGGQLRLFPAVEHRRPMAALFSHRGQ